jgi:hypothetical protein
MCLMLAGLRGIDEDIWKAARVDGIPRWKTYIFVIIPMMRPVFVTTLVIIASGIVKVYDLVVAQTSGGPGIASEVPAKYVYEACSAAQNLGQGFAASTMMLLSVLMSSSPGPIWNSEDASVTDMPPLIATVCHRNVWPARGPSPAPSPGATSCSTAPCAGRGLLPAAALRDDRHLAEGHAGNPARQHLCAAGRDHLRALGQGLGGRPARAQLRRAVARFLELGADHGAVGRAVDRHRLVNGYALANWKFKGADVFFTILIFGAFIPYQVMLYPIVILLRELGLYGTCGASSSCTPSSACRS